MEITWTGAVGATGYHVQRGPGASGPWTRINAARLAAAATSYTDTSAPAGSAVCYRVQAVFSGVDPPSAAACVTTPPAGGGWALTDPRVSTTARVGSAAIVAGTPTTQPVSTTPLPAPTGFKAVASGASSVDLSWNPVPGATGYVIMRSHFVAGVAMGTSSADVTPNGCLQATSHKDTGLARGEYRYHIRTCPGTAYAETTVQLGPKSGWYRITLNRFHVSQQTGDEPPDGTNDEIYLAVHVVDYDPSRPTPVLQRTLKTIVYQGVKTYDEIPPGGLALCAKTSAPHLDRAPLLVWEGELSDGVNGVLVAPTVWEWDNSTTMMYSPWTARMHDYPQDPSFPEWISAPMVAAVPGLVMLVAGSPCSGDRAIGMNCGTYWHPAHVAFTYRGVEADLASVARELEYCTGIPGIVKIDYEGFDGENYILYLQVERM